MRQIFSKSFIILMLVISAAGAAPAAHAQDIPIPDDAGTVPDLSGTALDPTGSITAANNAADAAAADTPTTYKGDSPYNSIMIKIMELFAWLLGVAALTLNYAAYYTVVTMGNYVNHLSAIGVSWRILRDIGNIMLIFGFLAVGITTILNVDWYGGGKKMLPMMLVAAVFLNFSLFISEAIIDTGNLFATQFYKQIVGGTLPTQSSSSTLTVTTASGPAALTPSNEGISNAIMSKLGLQTIYGNGIADPKIFDAGNPWLIGFMGIILFIITAFVMFSLAFVLIARFVVLIFLIILAPVGFAGLAVPMLAKRAGQWWSKLFEQTITAPILLLMLYIALTVITDQQFLMGSSGGNIANGAWTGTVGGGNIAGFASILLSFLVAMGLLLVVVIQSKKLSAFGADFASQTAGKLTFGLTAAGMRSTAGWGLNSAAQRFRSSKLARVPVIGRTFAGVLDRGAKASFDVRGTSALKNFPGGSIDAGKAQVGGYRQTEKDAIKAREEHAKSLTQTSGTFLGQRVFTGEKEQQEDAETAKTTAQANIASVEELKGTEIQAAMERHDVELNPFNKKIDEARETLRKAQNRQQPNALGTPEEKKKELEDAQRAMDLALRDKKEIQERHAQELKTPQMARDAAVKFQQEQIKKSEANIQQARTAPQVGYAAGLEWGPGKLLNRNTKAADNIRKEAKKSKSDKDMDKIKKLLEDSEKKESGGEEKKEEKKPEAPAPKPAS